MHKLHLLLVALLLAGAAVLGAVAVTRTTGLGSTGRRANDRYVAARAAQLATAERKLREALARRPPPLPPLPKARAAAPTPRIVYRRPPPVVVTVHRSHADDGHESEGGDG